MVLTITMTGTDSSTGNSGEMNIVSDMWISHDVPGYEEVRDFHKRMAEAIDWVPGDNPMLSRPDVAKAMAQVYEQGSKLDGLPLENLIKMGAAGQPGPSASGQSQQTTDTSQQQSSAQPNSVGSALSSAIGSRFGLGRHKKQDDASSPDAGTPSSGGGSASGSLIEMTTQVTGVNSNSVDASIFDVPAGFKQVEEELINSRHQH
jgi:hypothetical protein